MKILITVLLLALCLLTIAASAQKSTFEYKVENGVSENRINSLSAEGWEVTATGNYNGGMPYVILKRPK